MQSPCRSERPRISCRFARYGHRAGFPRSVRDDTGDVRPTVRQPDVGVRERAIHGRSWRTPSTSLAAAKIAPLEWCAPGQRDVGDVSTGSTATAMPGDALNRLPWKVAMPELSGVSGWRTMRG